jgi:chromosome partitioning protein
MTVVTFANHKGGVGKTTLAVNIAIEMAYRGNRVAVLDGDINQHASTFGTTYQANRPGLPITFQGGINSDNVLTAISKAEAVSDLVVVDLPAGKSELALKTYMKSSLVVIPAKRSIFDARDAGATAYGLAEAGLCRGLPVASILIWSQVTSQFETQNERAVREDFSAQLSNPENAILPIAMLSYDAYPSGFSHFWAPREVATHAGKKGPITVGTSIIEMGIPKSASKAAENIAAIADQILLCLHKIGEGTPPSVTLQDHDMNERGEIAA